MTYHHVPTIPFLVGPDKVSATTRYDRGVTITNQAPQSALYLQHADVKAAADIVSKDTVTLKSMMDAFTSAEGAWKTARTALGNAVVAWDASYEVFVSTGEKYAVTANDAHALGGVARGKTIHPLAMPIAVLFTYNPKKNWLRVHVRRAPGMLATLVEVSPDPITATSWVVLEGVGALRTIPNPAKGTWWARAQSLTAKAQSDFTTPVSVIVK
jgi:hypothetical protein